MTIEVRIATPSDVAGILAITAQVQAIHADAHPEIFKPVPPDGLPADAVLEAIAAPDLDVLVAVMESTVVGYARLERQVRSESAIKYARSRLYIHELGVRADMRLKGVGAALVAHICSMARTQGLREVAVDVMENNESAQAFYATQWFEGQRRVLLRRASPTGEFPVPVT